MGNTQTTEKYTVTRLFINECHAIIGVSYSSLIGMALRARDSTRSLSLQFLPGVASTSNYSDQYRYYRAWRRVSDLRLVTVPLRPVTWCSPVCDPVDGPLSVRDLQWISRTREGFCRPQSAYCECVENWTEELLWDGLSNRGSFRWIIQIQGRVSVVRYETMTEYISTRLVFYNLQVLEWNDLKCEIVHQRFPVIRIDVFLVNSLL